MKKITREYLLVSALIFLLLPFLKVSADDTPTADASTTPVKIEVAPLPDPVLIHLDIESSTSTLFNDAINVTPCVDFASSTPTVNAYCAIKQTGLESDWSDSGEYKFLNSISGISNDYSNNIYWGWFSNFDYGQTALNKHSLFTNEKLLVQIGRNPLKLAVSTTTPEINSTTTITVKGFGFVGWNGVWSPSASSTLFSSTGEQYIADEGGNIDVFISTTTPITFYATKNGFIDSNRVTIQVIDKSPVSTTTATSTPAIDSGGGSGQTHQTPDLEKMLSFLDANQKTDGSFGSDLYTDWAAVAYGTTNNHTNAKAKLKQFLRTDTLDGLAVTDYERRAMAMLAVGLNPYTDGTTDYIKKITDSFDGNQIGNSSLFNDDIFGIITLLSAGYNSSDSIIQKTAQFIISKQSSSGEWDSIDLTGAAIQALSLVRDVFGANTAISKGLNFLKASQTNDGGFYNIPSTTWAIQGIVAGSFDPAQVVSNGKNTFDYLTSNQMPDGSIGATTDNLDNKIWNTSYAIPAAALKTWPEILISVSKPTGSSVSGSSSADASTTIALSTTTATNTVVTVQNVLDVVNASSTLATSSSTIRTNITTTTSSKNQKTSNAEVPPPNNSNLLAGVQSSGFSFDTHKILMILGSILAGIGVFSIILF